MLRRGLDDKLQAGPRRICVSCYQLDSNWGVFCGADAAVCRLGQAQEAHVADLHVAAHAGWRVAKTDEVEREVDGHKKNQKSKKGARLELLPPATLLEQNDEWSLNRRYMQLEGLQTLCGT